MNRRSFLKALGFVPTTKLLTNIKFSTLPTNTATSLNTNKIKEPDSCELPKAFDLTKPDQLILIATGGIDYYTDFAKNLAYQLSKKSKVFYHCPTFTKKEIAINRFATMICGIPYYKYKHKKTTPDENLNFEKAKAKLINSYMCFIDNYRTSVSELKNILNKESKNKTLAKYIFINIDTLMTDGLSYKKIDDEEIFKLNQLKQVAIDFNTTIFVIKSIYHIPKEHRNTAIGLSDIGIEDLNSVDQIITLNKAKYLENGDRAKEDLEFSKYGPNQKFEYAYKANYNQSSGAITGVEILF